MVLRHYEYFKIYKFILNTTRVKHAAFDDIMLAAGWVTHVDMSGAGHSFFFFVWNGKLYYWLVFWSMQLLFHSGVGPLPGTDLTCRTYRNDDKLQVLVRLDYFGWVRLVWCRYVSPVRFHQCFEWTLWSLVELYLYLYSFDKYFPYMCSLPQKKRVSSPECNDLAQL